MVDRKIEKDKCTLQLSLSADSVEEMRGILIYLAENLEDIDKYVSSEKHLQAPRMKDKWH
jgi:hypothetical protein